MKYLYEALKNEEKQTEHPSEKKRRTSTLKAKFPLQKDDIILMNSGEQYQIRHVSIRGIYRFNSYSLVLYNASRPHAQQRVEKMSFSTLRELNWYMKKNRSEIIDVCCAGPREKELTIEECYKQALSIEEAREDLKEFYKN